MQDTISKPTSIEYTDFAKLDIRIATVLNAQIVNDADRLLCLTLDAGELGERTVVSGIREWYSPESLIGKQVVYLANLEPRKLRSILSQGMLLAAGDERPVLLQPEEKLSPGSSVR